MRSTGNSSSYFADTYALVEVFKGNPRYGKYRNSMFSTTVLNLAELYYFFLRVTDKTVADRNLELCARHVIGVTETAIKEGMTFKRKKRRNRLSYADCIGYATAKELGMPFLTGDEQFKDLPNVAFVK